MNNKEIISLYRYRNINQYSINELLTSFISATKAKNFNDPFDSYTLFNNDF
jgi:hypothetical protein